LTRFAFFEHAAMSDLSPLFAIRSRPQFTDEEMVSYGLDVIRSKVSPTALRQNDVEFKLLDLGMCNACADNAAAVYVKMAASRCGRRSSFSRHEPARKD
jgi:hypothetical protein